MIQKSRLRAKVCRPSRGVRIIENRPPGRFGPCGVARVKTAQVRVTCAEISLIGGLALAGIIIYFLNLFESFDDDSEPIISPLIYKCKAQFA